MVDDPVTERVRKNTQVVSDAAYKGVHPHIVEMDRRPGIIVGKLLNNIAIRNTVGKPSLLFSIISKKKYSQISFSLFSQCETLNYWSNASF